MWRRVGQHDSVVCLGGLTARRGHVSSLALPPLCLLSTSETSSYPYSVAVLLPHLIAIKLPPPASIPIAPEASHPHPRPRAARAQLVALAVLTPDRRSGLYKLDLPFTQGQDVVGTVVQLPKASHPATALGELKLGQRVWTPAGASFAEYAVAPWWKAAPLPDGVDPKDGVSMCTVALTAMALVREAYTVKKGDYILVRAAAGGVGLVLCQVGWERQG